MDAGNQAVPNQNVQPVSNQGGQNQNATPVQTQPNSFGESLQQALANDKANAISSMEQPVGNTGESQVQVQNQTPNQTEQGVLQQTDNNSNDVSQQGQPSGEPTNGTEQSNNADQSVQDNKTLDYTEQLNNLSSVFKQDVINTTQQEFNKAGIKQLTLNDLRVQQQDGSVVFKNPDNPNEYIDRYQAQNFIDSFNKEYEAKFNELANQIANEKSNQYKPLVEFIEYAPKFAELNANEKQVMEQLVKPFAIRSGNQIVGYNCNLNVMHATAKDLASKMQFENQPQQTIQNNNVQPQGANQNFSGPSDTLQGNNTNQIPQQQNQVPNPKNFGEALMLDMDKYKQSVINKNKGVNNV